MHEIIILRISVTGTPGSNVAVTGEVNILLAHIVFGLQGDWSTIVPVTAIVSVMFSP